MTAARGFAPDRQLAQSRRAQGAQGAPRPACASARARAVRERSERVRAARRRGRRRLALIVAVSTLVTILALSLAGSPAPGQRGFPPSLAAQKPAIVVSPTLHSSLARSIVIPGKAAALPFPSTGEGAVLVGGIGIVASSKDERSVPIASVTKIMTAYLVLRDHPLAGDAGGPVFTMTAADHAAWIRASQSDESNVEVVAGERLDERQLLQALMIPSADNIADYLAVWDAGSKRVFVAKMNATASRLHLSGTHFADASGVSPGSRGTAIDMARLAAVALQNPVLRQIVDEQFIRLPVMGEIWNNYDPAVGVDGIIGGKSGFTAAAQTNLVTAAWRTVGGHRVLVVCDVINQPDSLLGDANEDEALLNAASGELKLSRVFRRGTTVAEASAGWSHDRSAVGIDTGAAVVGWPGLVLSSQLVPAAMSLRRAEHGWPVGCAVGSVVLGYPYGTALTEPATLESRIGPPPAGWVPSGTPR